MLRTKDEALSLYHGLISIGAQQCLRLIHEANIAVKEGKTGLSQNEGNLSRELSALAEEADSLGLTGKNSFGEEGLVVTRDLLALFSNVVGEYDEEILELLDNFRKYWDEVGTTGEGVNTLDTILSVLEEGEPMKGGDESMA